MTPHERRASLGLAALFGLRMLGLFMLLPVFALAAVVFGLVNGLVAARLLAELPQRPGRTAAGEGSAGADGAKAPER